MITRCAPTAKWQWSYATGRYLGIEVEATTKQGRAVKGTLKADNLAELRVLLVKRGVSRAEAIRVTIE
jgi:hypothetical protein